MLVSLPAVPGELAASLRALSVEGIRGSLSDYATRRVLPGLVRHVRKVAPGVDLAVSQASRETMMAQLADGELDVALGIFPEYPEGIHVQELFPEHFVSLADESALPECGCLTLDEWLERPHVMLALRPDANNEIEKVLASMGVRRRIAVALPHWSAAIELIAGTDLILTVASWAVGEMGKYPSLRTFDAPLDLPTLSYQQAWHVRKEADPANQWMRETIHTCSQATR